MTPCPDSNLLQDYLDRELVPDQMGTIEAHLAECRSCARELANYRLVFDRLGNLPLFEPSPALVERILAEAMPAHPARWVKFAGWAYAASLIASLGGLAVATSSPAPRAWMSALTADAARSVVRSLLFVLQSVNAAFVHTADAMASGGLQRSLPLLHAVVKPLGQPAVLFTIWAAVVVGVAVLWWMRPREGRSVRGSRNVGVLGF